jgi:hypothetical protein
VHRKSPLERVENWRLALSSTSAFARDAALMQIGRA